MKQKLDTWLRASSETAHYLRLVVGGYIAYLGGDIILGFIRGEAGGAPLLALSIFLVLAGAAVAAVCLYALLRGLSLEKSRPREDAEEPSTEDGDKL